jgi:hypothetical protein
MDNLTQKIKILNDVYREMKKSFDTLEKLFKKTSNIQQKIVLAEQMVNDIYRSIYNKIESETIQEEFIKIIKGARDAENKKRK